MTMPEQIDIYRVAWLLIKEHGEDANLVAAKRADELLAQGEMEGCATFKRVLAAILELRRGKQPDDLAH